MFLLLGYHSLKNIFLSVNVLLVIRTVLAGLFVYNSASISGGNRRRRDSED